VTVYLNSTKRQPINKRSKHTQKNGNLQFSQILYTLLGFILILGLLYGAIANKVVTTGYDIKFIEKKLANLKNKNDELKIIISELKSVRTLEGKITEIGMIEPKDADYIRLGKEVALKK